MGPQHDCYRNASSGQPTPARTPSSATRATFSPDGVPSGIYTHDLRCAVDAPLDSQYTAIRSRVDSVSFACEGHRLHLDAAQVTPSRRVGTVNTTTVGTSGDARREKYPSGRLSSRIWEAVSRTYSDVMEIESVVSVGFVGCRLHAGARSTDRRPEGWIVALGDLPGTDPMSAGPGTGDDSLVQPLRAVSRDLFRRLHRALAASPFDVDSVAIHVTLSDDSVMSIHSACTECRHESGDHNDYMLYNGVCSDEQC
jgi:hypothetical protein